ncbi:MAG: hypothetical protein IJZ29_03360 [Clostridia bacterium]|nr:hypothetical protein [Clostridia bacterium]
MTKSETTEIVNHLIQKYINEFKNGNLIDLDELKILLFEDFDKIAPNTHFIVKNMTFELVELQQQFYLIKNVFEEDLQNILNLPN